MLKYGKKPARPDAVTLKFSQVFDETTLPTPPLSFGHEGLAKAPWGMLANDKWGDCVWAGAAHEHMLWTVEGDLPEAVFTSKEVLADYSAVTGFDPNNPATDQGTDMQMAAAYRQKVGVLDNDGVRHKIDAYSALEVGNLTQLAVSAYIFSAVGVGVNCPFSMQSQFTNGKPWDVVDGDRVVGGHYVPCIGRNSAGNFVFISWGRLQAATPRWVSTYMTEGIAYLNLEFINASTKVSLESFNLDALTSYLKGV